MCKSSVVGKDWHCMPKLRPRIGESPSPCNYQHPMNIFHNCKSCLEREQSWQDLWNSFFNSSCFPVCHKWLWVEYMAYTNKPKHNVQWSLSVMKNSIDLLWKSLRPLIFSCMQPNRQGQSMKCSMLSLEPGSRQKKTNLIPLVPACRVEAVEDPSDTCILHFGRNSFA